MCGFAGYFTESSNVSPISVLERMSQAILHRGPDSTYHYISPNEQFGVIHNRLSILGLGDQGAQPMLSKDNRFLIAFNGEIYNYLELKFDLIKNNIPIIGDSDTEVFVEGISFYGLDFFIKKTIGMFAGVCYDLVTNTIFLFRDRVGKKPIYYSYYNNVLYFGSEIKSLLTINNFVVSKSSLSNYLTLGYVPGIDTIYDDVYEVSPGYVYKFSNRKLKSKECYWQFSVERDRKLTFDEAVSHTESLLIDAVKLRLRSDVKLGVFLSGGIDSGLLTSFASINSSSPINTYTVASNSKSHDESSLAALVASRYSTNHNTIYIDDDIISTLDEVASGYDEPIADPSIIPSYKIAKEAAKHVKVVLNGEGSDELFAGYRRHRAYYIYDTYKYLFKLLPTKSLSNLLNHFGSSRDFRSRTSYAIRFLNSSNSNKFTKFISLGGDLLTQSEKLKLMGYSPVDTQDYLNTFFSSYENLPDYDYLMTLDFLSSMRDGLLPKIDMSTMASSVEGRSPFLDHNVIDFVSSIDSRLNFKGSNTKPILRSIASKYLPIEIATAPKKGFEIPILELLNGPLNNFSNDLLNNSNSKMYNYLSKKAVIELLDSLSIDPIRKSKVTWSLMNLSLWFEKS